MNYQIENKLNELQNRESYYTAAAAALKAITRNYKKNGEPFQNMKQNFNNCTIRTENYANITEEKELCVYFQSRGRYESYDIRLYENIGAYTDTDYTKKPGTIINRGNYLKKLYLYTVDEVAEIIAERIKQCEKYAAEYAEKIANIQEMETTAEKIREMVKNSPYRYELADLLRNGFVY